MGLEQLVERMPKFGCKHKGCRFQKVTSNPVKDHEENEYESKIGLRNFLHWFYISVSGFVLWWKSFLKFKKATQDFTKNKSEGCTGGMTVK